MFPVPLPFACFRRVVVSTSVYVGVDRVVVIELLRMAGTTVTRKLNKRNTHLICLHPIGMKYEKAREWGLCIVTARWVVQSVINGELLDTSRTEFQVIDDEANPTSSTHGQPLDSGDRARLEPQGGDGGDRYTNVVMTMAMAMVRDGMSRAIEAKCSRVLSMLESFTISRESWHYPHGKQM